MSDNPYDFSKTLLGAGTLMAQKDANALEQRKQLLEQGRKAYEAAVAERDKAFTLLGDKNVQASDDLYAYAYNKWAALESKLTPGAKLPLVENPTAEDRKTMERVAKVWMGVKNGIIRQDVGIKLSQGILSAGMGASNDPEALMKNFGNFVKAQGVGGDMKQFQDGDKDVTAIQNQYGEMTPVAEAPNFEADENARDQARLGNENERIDLEKQRLALEKNKAEKGDKGAQNQEEAIRLKKIQIELQAAEKEVKAGKVKKASELLASFPLIGSFFKGDENASAKESISQIRQQLQAERTGSQPAAGKKETIKVTSQAQYEKLKPGDTYEWNGKTYTKK